jgi:eukaryotic-like serine/threonine-protein kinase
MSLETGTLVDRYEVLGLLGKGAMGEVYRARDARIGRDVAIKVLPAAFSSDTERLRRFDQEARAAGALNHPNVVAIFDVGSHGNAPFVVTELLDGHTLRTRLNDGPPPLRKALDFGVQVARGLAAAHAKGIVHRDLKPENLFVTNDGHLKILDFGLAKLVRGEGHSDGPADSLMATAMTEMGRVMGTVGYMAPEQVRGEAADHRADIFALGCVLYELLTGRPPFHRESAVESMAAIVREEMPPLDPAVEAKAPGLGPLLRRCVEKQPGERFESARDFAFSLEALMRGLDAAGAGTAAAEAAVERVTFQRVTFRRGVIWSARFTPDGHSVVYSASWEGRPIELFWSHLGNPEARALGFQNGDLGSVSGSSEMAVLLRAQFVTSFDRRGTLARVPTMGGAPRELLHDVHAADWSPDGQQLAVVRSKQGMIRLEFPIGNVLYQTAGWIGHMRVSPDGQAIAFADHPSRGTDSGTISVVDRKGERRVLTEDWGTIRGMAWSADGREVWFTADRHGAARGLYAVSLDGRLRHVLQLASNLTLHDVARDGRVLVGHGTERAGINLLAKGAEREHDVSWLDWSLLQDLSADGRTILFDETAEGGGETGAVYLRPIDGSGAVRLGEGTGRAISPDGEWVVGAYYTPGEQGRMFLMPTGVGEPRPIVAGDLHLHHAAWLPDQRHLVVSGHEPGRGIRLYRLHLETGEHQPFTPEGMDYLEFRVLPNGTEVSGINGDDDHWIYPIDGSAPRPLGMLDRADRIVRWLPDGRSLLSYRLNELPAKIHRVDVETGERIVWREIAPPDPTGIFRIGRVRTSADGMAHGYVYYMHLVDLHVLSGLK